ncbi:hypothetical protein GF358_03440 [Candidatus Woesearchaeota archaeon]|nr:hypothetical protein [Candidatus Woesearchaeota archaeon]
MWVRHKFTNAEKGFANLAGIEPSKNMFNTVEEIKIIGHIDLIKEKFDVILVLDVLEHIKNDKLMINKLQKN